jgi:hypothetical protein
VCKTVSCCYAVQRYARDYAISCCARALTQISLYLIVLSLQELYRKTGVKNMPMTFLLTDLQIVDDEWLVYINDVLSSGFIPGTFNYYITRLLLLLRALPLLLRALPLLLHHSLAFVITCLAFAITCLAFVITCLVFVITCLAFVITCLAFATLLARFCYYVPCLCYQIFTLHSSPYLCLGLFNEEDQEIIYGQLRNEAKAAGILDSKENMQQVSNQSTLTIPCTSCSPPK